MNYMDRLEHDFVAPSRKIRIIKLPQRNIVKRNVVESDDI